MDSSSEKVPRTVLSKNTYNQHLSDILFYDHCYVHICDFLTTEQRQQCVLLSAKIVPNDDLCGFNSETNQQSLHSASPKKVHQVRHSTKSMLMFFFGSRWFMHHEFIHRSHTSNALC